MLLAGGLGVDNFGGLFGLYALPCGVTWLMTIMTVVLIINAVNLIDGIDGLASGLSAIALGFFAAIFYIHGVYDCAMIALATMGVVLSFFYYNVFGDAAKYKKIFMGDTGSLTLGFILTCLAFRALHLPVTVGPFPNINRFVLAFAPLLVPCFDVVRVFIVRLSLRHNPFMPDRRHLHHAMMAAGLPHRQTMMLILLISVFFIVVDCMLAEYINITYVLVVDIALYVGMMLLLRRIRLSRTEKDRLASTEETS